MQHYRLNLHHSSHVCVQAIRVEELRGNSDEQQTDSGAQCGEWCGGEAGLPRPRHQGGTGIQQPGGGDLLSVLCLQVGAVYVCVWVEESGREGKT